MNLPDLNLIVGLTLYAIFVHCKTINTSQSRLSTYEIASFDVPTIASELEPKFNSFTVHNTTGDVYLGSSDTLVHLDCNYTVIEDVSTANPNCASTGNANNPRNCLNHGKLVTIAYETDRLITCGSRKKGKCQMRDTGDISIVLLESDDSIVPSAERRVAYAVAPARQSTSQSSVEDVLYLAAEYSTRMNNFTPQPLCRRSFNGTDFATVGKVQRAENIPENFVSQPVDVYVRNGFTYFLTNQQYDFYHVDLTKPEEYPGILPKISRVCHRDESDELDSYTEIVIYCRGSDGTDYNLVQDVHIGEAAADLARSLDINPGDQVLYAVFAEKQSSSNEPSNKSAMCIYDLDEIDDVFIKAIQTCLECSNNTCAISYLHGGKCDRELDSANATATARDQQCTAEDYAHPNGRLVDTLISNATMEWSNILATSIATTTVQNHTIAFVGTAQGGLLKIHIDEARVYETLSLGSPVLKDPIPNGAQEIIHVLTEKRLFKLAVENCGNYTTCDECMGSNDGDPYCGWCVAENRCTRLNECSETNDPSGWLSYKETQCPSRGQEEMVLQSLDCADYTGCSNCTAISSCTWCQGNGQQCGKQCIANEKDARRECHRLSDLTDSILIPSGVPRMLEIPIENVMPVSGNNDMYECILHIEGETQNTTAQRMGDTIHCNAATQYTYQAEERELVANVSIYHGGDVPQLFENVLEVTLYKCELRNSSCDQCTADIDSELRCGWCTESQLCAVNDHPKCHGLWLNATKDCPKPPNVTTIWPSSGPVEGHTMVEISGTGFGSLSNITNVTVAGKECTDIKLESLHDSYQRLNCNTTMAEVDRQGPVLVTVEAIDGNVYGNVDGPIFSYRDPCIEDFSPSLGPRSGGTTLTIYGQNLLTGRNIDIFIGNAACSLDRDTSTPSRMVCSTGSSYLHNISPITMLFDSSKRQSKHPYRYTGDLDVESLETVDILLDISNEEFVQAVDAKAPTRILKSFEEQISSIQMQKDNFTFDGDNVDVFAVKLPQTSFDGGLGFASVPGYISGDTQLFNNPDDIPVEVEASIVLPMEVVARFRDAVNASALVPVSFVLYQNSKLFQSQRLRDVSTSNVIRQVGSRVISATIEGLKITGLTQPVESTFLMIKPENFYNTITNVQCVFWDFDENDGNGDWSTNGCRRADTTDGDRILCQCDHLTSFAVLIDVHGQKFSSLVLDVISKIGCWISITALIITIVTYLSSKSFRNKTPKQILICLSFTLLGLYMVFVIGVDQNESYTGCIAVAVLLHYLTLASVAWMGVEAINLYLLVIKVYNAHVSHFMTKACILAWGGPLVPVILVLAIDMSQYYNDHHCFMQANYAFYFADLLLLFLILTANFVIFIMVIYKLTCGRKVARSSDGDNKQAITRAVNAVAISSILGLTWVFGFLTIIENRGSSIAFQALFCLFNSLQGFAIFLLFCVRSEDVRNVWKRWFGCGESTGRSNYSGGKFVATTGNTLPMSSKTTAPQGESIQLSTTSNQL